MSADGQTDGILPDGLTSRGHRSTLKSSLILPIERLCRLDLTIENLMLQIPLEAGSKEKEWRCRHEEAEEDK